MPAFIVVRFFVSGWPETRSTASLSPLSETAYRFALNDDKTL